MRIFAIALPLSLVASVAVAEDKAPQANYQGAAITVLQQQRNAALDAIVDLEAQLVLSRQAEKAAHDELEKLKAATSK